MEENEPITLEELEEMLETLTIVYCPECYSFTKYLGTNTCVSGVCEEENENLVFIH